MHARPRFPTRSLATGGLLAAFGLLLAACASGPTYPLYSAQAITGSFGYSEQRIDEDSFRITYVAPTRSVSDSRSAVDERRESLLTLTNDMAIWRAADLARVNGQKEFRVIRRDNDVDVDRQYYDRFRPSPAGYRRFGAPYPYHYYGPSSSYYDSHVRLRARTSLTIEFGRRPGEEFFIADDAIARLRQTYPGADQQPVSNQQGLMFP